MIIIDIIFVIIIFWGLLKAVDKLKEKSIKIRNNTNPYEEKYKVEVVSDEPPSVILKTDSFNPDNIKEYKGENIKQFEFRPQQWEQFISQEQAKNQAKIIIKKVKRNIKGHLFLSARQGMGKTTFIQLLARELNAKLITRVGKQLDDPNELINVINEINTSQEDIVIFFIDEIDSLDKKIIKVLNPVIEQFETMGKKIKPFIFASASINKDILIKNNPDFLDRIGHHIHFVPYSNNNIKNIIKQYASQLYSNENISEEVFDIISNSCKFCPRIAISLLEDFIVEQNVKKILQYRRIIKEGLTEIDIKILRVLNESIKPMGANAVALRSGLTQKQYTEEFEPYLYEFGYINRTPSRIISKKGKNFLKEC